MERKFELVEKYKELGEEFIPRRGTQASAGYDFKCAEDTVVPSLFRLIFECGGNDTFLQEADEMIDGKDGMTLADTKTLLKRYGCRPTLVPTGIKAKMSQDEYLGLKARSSTPLNYLLVVANGEGIIDSDYYNNPDNEGHIFVQFINLSPFDILIKKGEKIAQGIFIKYGKTDDDNSTEVREGGFGSTGK